MITENLRGKELFNEVYSDFQLVKKELKKRRQDKRKPFVKYQKPIKEMIQVDFTFRTPKYNTWIVKSGMIGPYNKPKALNHFHLNTNAGSGGSKLGIIYRGIKSTESGYIVSVTSHVITRMKERNPEFKDKTYDELVEIIFKHGEEGVYYDYPWKTTPKTSIPMSSQEVLSLEQGRPVYKEEPTVQIILKTSAGIFLGVSSLDRSEVRLITYITDLGEELEEVVNEFLIPAWICYNNEMFSDEYVKEVYSKLMEYMKGKEDRNVYRLGE